MNLNDGYLGHFFSFVTPIYGNYFSKVQPQIEDSNHNILPEGTAFPNVTSLMDDLNSKNIIDLNSSGKEKVEQFPELEITNSVAIENIQENQSWSFYNYLPSYKISFQEKLPSEKIPSFPADDSIISKKTTHIKPSSAEIVIEADDLDEEKPIDRFPVVDIANLVDFNKIQKYQEWKANQREIEKNLKSAQKGPPNFILNSASNLVCQGGGAKGLGYIGMSQTLEARKIIDSIVRVCGASAGAAAALLFALGHNSSEMNNLLINNPLSSFLDNHTSNNLLNTILNDKNSLVMSFRMALNIYHTYNDLQSNLGLCDGEELRKWLGGIIENKIGDRNFTFGELRQKINNGDKTLKHLHISVTLIKNNAQLKRLSSEDPECDSIIIADAILGSMSIPFVFKPQLLFAKNSEGERYPLEEMGLCLDGGLIDNLPADTFDRKKFFGKNVEEEEKECPKFNKRTLCLSFDTEKAGQDNEKAHTNINNIAYAILTDIFYEAEKVKQNINPYNEHRIVKINVGNVGMLDFNLCDEAIAEMIAAGKNDLESFFKSQEDKADLLFVDRRIKEADKISDSDVKALAFEDIAQLYIKNQNFNQAVDIAKRIPHTELKKNIYNCMLNKMLPTGNILPKDKHKQDHSNEIERIADDLMTLNPTATSSKCALF